MNLKRQMLIDRLIWEAQRLVAWSLAVALFGLIGVMLFESSL